jgi:aspartate/methionine/tyrosine aminotransferase
MQALDLCFRTLLSPHDRVLLPFPGFFIDGIVRAAGGALAPFPSPERDAFRPAWGTARDTVAAAKVLFINSPVNPTGYVFDETDLEAALELAEQHDLWIVSDESYSHYVYGHRRHRTISILPGAADRTLIVRSFSKDFAMSGWRVGYLHAPPTIIDDLRRALEWSCLCVSRITQAAALAALEGPRDWIAAFVDESEVRAGFLADAINDIPDLSCRPPAGGLNLLVRYAETNPDAIDDLIINAGVPAHPGEAFGAPGYFRLQFGASHESLARAVDRIREWQLRRIHRESSVARA